MATHPLRRQNRLIPADARGPGSKENRSCLLPAHRRNPRPISSSCAPLRHRQHLAQSETMDRSSAGWSFQPHLKRRLPLAHLFLHETHRPGVHEGGAPPGAIRSRPPVRSSASGSTDNSVQDTSRHGHGVNESSSVCRPIVAVPAAVARWFARLDQDPLICSPCDRRRRFLLQSASRGCWAMAESAAPVRRCDCSNGACSAVRCVSRKGVL
jgi:hypothetical protein